MENYEIIDMLNKMERALELIKYKHDVNEIAERILHIQRLLQKFGSLEELIKHLQTIEKYVYVGKDLLSIEEAAKYMCVSTSFVYRLTSRRGIATYKPSGKLAYIAKADLNAWMMQNMQATKQDLEELARVKIAELAHEKGYSNRKQK